MSRANLFDQRAYSIDLSEVHNRFFFRLLSYCDKPNNFKALKAVAKATSSGVLFIKAAIISTIAGRLHGSFR